MRNAFVTFCVFVLLILVWRHARPWDPTKEFTAPEVPESRDIPALQPGAGVTIMPAPGPDHLDADESYAAPDLGRRPLYRLAGGVSVRAVEGVSPPVFAAALIKVGGPLEGYRWRGTWPNGVVELMAPPEEISRQHANPARLDRVIEDVREAGLADFEAANPIHIDPDTGLKLIAFGDMIVKLAPGVEAETYFGAEWDDVRPLKGSRDEFILTLSDKRAEHLFAQVDALSADPRVVWAEPDFISESRPASVPNDPLYPDSWHLENKGQIDGKLDADVDAEEAWRTSKGSPEIVVAVIDDAFDLSHEDLKPNLAINEGETGTDANGNDRRTNGIDDDANGFIDDVNGWDSYADDNDPGSFLGRSTFDYIRGGGGARYSVSMGEPDISGFDRIFFDPNDYTPTPTASTPRVYISRELGETELYFKVSDINGDVILEKSEDDVESYRTDYLTLLRAALPDFPADETYVVQPNRDDLIDLVSALFNKPYGRSNHGTAVSGVAVAKGDNDKGSAGIAPNCSWLPMKLGSTDSQKAEGMRYVAGLTGTGNSWQGADVVNMSFSAGSSAVYDSALDAAATQGRNGKGCLLFAATGNSASGWMRVKVDLRTFLGGLFDPSGAQSFRWRYHRNPTIGDGDNAVWIDNVSVPTSEGTVVSGFDDGTAEGFTTSSANGWDLAFDSGHAKGTGGNGTLRTGNVQGSETADLTYIVETVSGQIEFDLWVSTEQDKDLFEFYIDDVKLLTVSGIPGRMTFTKHSSRVKGFAADSVRTNPSYPANRPSVIGVGGSTTYDNRVDYSQFGTQAQGLDLVTPTGFLAGNIVTTDISGEEGYTTSNYTYTFNGTSSASPLASGIGALLLSVNPDLDAATARNLLHEACDKIGPDTYTADANGRTRNHFYGYGKLNAALAVRKGIESYGLKKPNNLAGTYTGGVENRITWDYDYPYERSVLYVNTSPSLDGASSLGLREDQGSTSHYSAAVGDFYYAVRVYGPVTGQESALSDWVKVERAIPTPDNFRASKGNYFDRVVVSWLPVSGIDDYVLTRSVNGGAATTIAVTRSPYIDTNVSLGEVVTYSIQARKGNAASAASPDDTGSIGEPVSITATQGTLAGKVSISWDPIPNTLGSALYRTTTTSPPQDTDFSGRPDIDPVSQQFLGTSTTDETALDGQLYYYWVGGYREDGTLSALSGPAQGFAAPSPSYASGGANVSHPEDVPFRWIDISESGEAIMTETDDGIVEAPLGISFPFFGDTLFSIYLSSNGYLTSDENDLGNDHSNDCPIPAVPNVGGGARIYPYHDDLVVEGDAAVYHQTFRYQAHPYRPPIPSGGRGWISIYQWNNVRPFNGTATFSFQVILFESGDIIYQYLPGNPGGESASIGVQSDGADQGVSIACNTAGSIPTDAEHAILIKAPAPTPITTPVEVIVTTHLDEDDGDLGLGAGDSLREVAHYSAGNIIRFDPSLTDKTILITGTPVTMSSRIWDGRDAPGLTISGGGILRPVRFFSGFGMTLKNLTIADSYVDGDGGALENYGALFLENVTIRNCEATGKGGALYCKYDSSVFSLSPLIHMINCTFSDNESGDSGGAIYLENVDRFNIIQCTIANNFSSGQFSSGGGIFLANPGPGFFYNNIVANNAAVGSFHEDIDGDPSSDGYNMVRITHGTTLAATDIHADPLLLPLARNGGPTQTHGLQQGSPAIDAGGTANSGFDQRGRPRGRDGNLDGVAGPDMGAFEADIPAIVVTTGQDVVDANDDLLSLREAVALTNSGIGNSIGFDTNAMGTQTCTLANGSINLNGGNTLTIAGGASSQLANGELLGFWRFDDDQGGEVPNDVARDGAVVISGNATRSSTNARPSFGGTLDTANSGHAADILPNRFTPEEQVTVAAWVRPSSYSDVRAIVSNDAAFALSGWFGGYFLWSIKTSDGVQSIFSLGGTPADQWVFVVGTYDGHEMRLYLNGLLQTTKAVSGNIVYDPSAAHALHIGSNPLEGNQFDGLIDDVMLYDTGASTAEVQQLMNLAPLDGIVIDANDTSRVFALSGTTNATFENLKITGGNSHGISVSSSAILTMNDCQLYGNISSGGGGGMRNEGTAILNRCSVYDNTATGAWGGGIDNVFGGRLTLNHSTVSNNHALAGNGGGIDNFSNTILVLNHTTISGNTASGSGGGVYNHGDISELYHCTFANNSAGITGDGMHNNAGAVQSGFSLFANHEGPDYTGELVSLGHNLLEDASGATITGESGTDRLGLQAELATALRDNGGVTLTHALGAGSPAIDVEDDVLRRDIVRPGDPVAASGPNNSPPAAGPEMAFDNDSATVYQSYDTHLLAFWDFNVTGDPTDRVRGITGTLESETSISADGQGRSGEAGDRALHLAESEQGMTASGTFVNEVALRDTVTVSWWQKRANASEANGALALISPGSAEGWGLVAGAPGIKSETEISFITSTTGGDSGLDVATPGNVDWTAWHHLVVVKNGFQRQIWLDGELVGSDTGAAPLLDDFTTLLFGFAEGSYDDLALFGVALTKSQITTLFNEGVASAGAEFIVSPSIGLGTVNGMELTSAPTLPAADPAAYRIEGSVDGTRYTLISEGTIPAFPGRGSSQVLEFDSPGAYRHFRLSFPSTADPSQTSVLQLGEIALLNIPARDQRERTRIADGDGNRTKLADIGAYELQTYVVDSDIDGSVTTWDPDRLGNGELRSAVEALEPADLIVFDPLTMDGATLRINPSKHAIIVDHQLTIDASSLTDGLTLDGQTAALGLFEIGPNADLTLKGLTLRNSQAPALVNYGVFTLRNCTVRNNVMFKKDGAGLLNHGTALVESCTFSANRSLTMDGDRGEGGAIHNTGTLTLRHSTLAFNEADYGGGLYNASGATANIGHTIIANNAADIQGPNVFGNVVSLRYNLVENALHSAGWIAPEDRFGQAHLSPLARNGGPTETHALQSQSPALDAGDPNITTAPLTDQRGSLRIAGNRIDIGAHEHNEGNLKTGLTVNALNVTEAWAEFYGFAADIQANALLDSDGDGLTNAQESEAGTDPLDPHSKLEFTSNSTLTADTMMLEWESVPDIVYSIWESDNLRDWDPIRDSTTLATGPISSITLDANERTRSFYEVRVGPVPSEDVEDRVAGDD